jgi:hypothetical protein
MIFQSSNIVEVIIVEVIYFTLLYKMAEVKAKEEEGDEAKVEVEPEAAVT